LYGCQQSYKKQERNALVDFLDYHIPVTYNFLKISTEKGSPDRHTKPHAKRSILPVEYFLRNLIYPFTVTYVNSSFYIIPDFVNYNAFIYF